MSESVNVRTVNIHKSCREVVQEYILHLEKTSDGKEFIKLFVDQSITSLGTVRWTPELEFCITCINNDQAVLHLTAYALLESKKSKSLHLWRRGIDTSLIPVFTNQCCKFREPRTTTLLEYPKHLPPPDNEDSSESPKTFLLQAANKKWFRVTMNGTCEESSSTLTGNIFCNVPQRRNESKNLNLVLVLLNDEIKIFCNDVSIGSFSHSVQNADYFDSFRLSGDEIIVVRIGRRNALTGGLMEEELFSFFQGLDGKVVPNSLSEDKTREVEKICKGEYDGIFSYNRFNSIVTGWNDLESGSSWVLDKTQKMNLGNELILSIFGHYENFYVLFYSGRIQWIKHNMCVKNIQVDFPLISSLLDHGEFS